MKTVLSLLSLVFLTVPAFAVDAPGCIPFDTMLANLKTSGVDIKLDSAVNGVHVDRIVVYVDTSGIWMIGSQAGCFIGPLFNIDSVPIAPVTPQSAPVLHGGGAEVGA